MDSLPQGRTAREESPGDGRAAAECEALLNDWRRDQAANDTRMSQLARTIELEIIPRLMLAHRAGQPPAVQEGSGDSVVRADLTRFAALVLDQDEDVAFAWVETLRARSVSVEAIYMDLLAPTARYLGELWEQDLCTFTDVTVGLGRLQRVLRELSPSLGLGMPHADHGRRILLLPSPGEQHTFGLVMVAEFFRRAGWDVVGGAWAAGVDAAEMAANEWFDVVGFSLGAEVHLPALTTGIAALRQAARNQRVAVLVGGPIFAGDPSLADHVGADGMTIDGREAPLLAERLVAATMAKHGAHG